MGLFDRFRKRQASEPLVAEMKPEDAAKYQAKDHQKSKSSVLTDVENLMHETLRKNLPDVGPDELESDGAVFYMNGKNGTEFEWYVNEHFPPFMIFYNDKENLGAVKALLYTDGGMSIFVYGDSGHSDPVEVHKTLKITKQELLLLAVILWDNADAKSVFDEDIRKIDTGCEPDVRLVEDFIRHANSYKALIDRKLLINKTVIVSKKVRTEGWKIGYGRRDEAASKSDSGWFFSVGNETDEYINDPANLEIWAVSSAVLYDQALWEFIDAPYGTAIVRVSPDKFELDDPEKRIFLEKKQSPGDGSLC